MSSKTKYVIGGIIGAIIIVVLFLIPASEFGIESKNSESPPPILVLSNNPDDFEISPIKCEKVLEIVEFEFNVQNNLEEDYRLEIHLTLKDEKEQDLSKEAKLVEVSAGETTLVTHQTPFNSKMSMCGIELEDVEKIQ
ncbi:MAG: hypothetical protein P8X83_00885 [Nitrosopumilaceae archaeon]